MKNFTASVVKSGGEDRVDIKFIILNKSYNFWLDARSNEGSVELCNVLTNITGNAVGGISRKGAQGPIKMAAHLAQLMSTSSAASASAPTESARPMTSGDE